MKRSKRSHRVIALFLVFSMLPSLVPYNMLQASGNGPTAPEATGFEPVDATDMVNLVTGDFSYVLPLLNVPSPEGGYPLALAYHAGIAMDQEASWVGLGWSLNPGAINRSVNGYPDDYSSSQLSEYFYDQGEREDVYSLSLGFTANSGTSVGLNLSWGSNRSLGGSVSVGYGASLAGGGRAGGGISLGTNGVGVNAGYTTPGGLSLGINAHSSGNYGGSIGFDNNGQGFSVGLSSSGTVSLFGSSNNNSIGIKFSSNGMGIYAGGGNPESNSAIQGGGVGIQLAFNNSVSIGDYTVNTSGWLIPIMIPTYFGVFSLSFGKQRMRYYLGKEEQKHVSGPVYFNEKISNIGKWQVLCVKKLSDYATYTRTIGYAPSQELAEQLAEAYEGDCDSFRYIKKEIGEVFMDIYEVPLVGNVMASQNELELNNPVFPAYDNYNVQAQGLSGGMSSRLFKNGALLGLSNRKNDKGYELNNAISGEDPSKLPNHIKFDARPDFYLDNEISTYLGVEKATFNTSATNNRILGYYSEGVDPVSKPRRVNGNYIEYFTNDEIINSSTEVKAKGFLSPIATGFNRASGPSEGIGAFKITAPDGKTYHYSLPVYNHEIITRTFGVVSERPEEEKSYFEKRQLDPYATHWLLTTVTGPDYVDKNGNGKADKGDYGYWTAFEYGKWSDAFVWKAPYGKDYFVDEANGGIKTQIHGRKEIYYLDKIITRTHKALFIKEERYDGQSVAWSYKSVAHDGSKQNSNDFQERFAVPKQNTLRLKKIILVKETDNIPKNSGGTGNPGTVEINYNDSYKQGEIAQYNMWNNVLDDSDNWAQVMDKTIKSIDFAYSHDLAKGTPNAPSNIGRSTLAWVHFKGKAGASVIPPYRFAYHQDYSIFDIEDKDAYGYYEPDNKWSSLHTITTPQGGKIDVTYESHALKPVFNSAVTFVKGTSSDYSISKIDPVTYRIDSKQNIGIKVGETLSFKYHRNCVWKEPGNCGGPCGGGVENCDFEVTAQVTTHEGGNRFRIKIPNNECTYIDQQPYCISSGESFSASYKIINALNGIGGIRTSAITVEDGRGNTYTTQYKYGKNENGTGYVSYVPFAPELLQELPYSAELPAPKGMYEYVTVKPAVGGKTRYRFNVMKEKSSNGIKYGDFYEIVKNKSSLVNNQGIEVDVSNFTIKDNLSAIGQLLEVEVYNKEDQLLSKIVNDYYPRGTTPDKLGIIQESYQSYKIVDYIENTSTLRDKWLVNSSSRIKYPILLRSSTEYRGGHIFKTEFKNRNVITGQAHEVKTVSSTGDSIRSKTVFAYNEYPQMGSKVINEANKNMLTQTIASYSEVTDNNGDWKTTGVGITTWKAWDNDVWRKHKVYTWKGELNTDGTFKNFTDNFDWSATTGTQPAGWQMLSEVTRYDVYSNTLEVRDMNGNYASTKWGNNKVFSTSNTTYNAMFFSGAEDASGNTFSGGVSKDASAAVTPSRAHTGEKSVQVAANVKAFKVTPVISDTYRVSVWADKSNYTNTRVLHNNQNYSYNTEELVLAGNWVQLNFTVPVAAGKEVALVTSSGTAYYDDFRIHPVSSSMTSYVYNDFDELTHILGANNMGTKYEYDDGGRLIKTFAEVVNHESNPGGFKIVKEIDYSYQENITPDSPYNPMALIPQIRGTFNESPEFSAITNGGSGYFEYRWALSEGNYSNTYDAWTLHSSRRYIMTCPDDNGSTVYYRCQVRDKVTGEIKTKSGNFVWECSEDIEGEN